MSKWTDLLGTTASFFKLGLAGVRLKNNSGNLAVRNSGDTADAEVTASKVNVSGDALVINSDAAGSGADWKVTFTRPAAGMTADVAYTLPVDDGTPNQVLATDGSGVMSWVSAASTSAADKCDTTNLAFNSSGTVAMFSTGAGDIIDKIQVAVDTAFDGTSPSMSVGISGTVSKYVASTQVDLTTVGLYEINPGKSAQGVEALITTFTAGGGATAGAARVLVYYNTPT
jgi:hypothetical protein